MKIGVFLLEDTVELDCARLHSAQRAREVRRFMQHDPEPPV